MGSFKLPIAQNETSSILLDYRFNFPRTNWKFQTIPLGFACIYNHSNSPNARWETDEENELFVFSTVKDIKKDEEICTYYGGDSYWNDGRTHTKIV